MTLFIYFSLFRRSSASESAQILKSISAREHFKEVPRLGKQLWAGEFWGDGCFVRSVGDNVTVEVIRRYIHYHDDSDKPQQLSLWD